MKRCGMRGLIALASALAVTGCDGDAPTAPRLAAMLIAMSPVEQVVNADEQLSNGPRVRAIDDSGQPVAGLVVRFQPLSGTSSVSSGTATTDALGFASTSWTPRNAGELHVLEAVAEGFASATFRATTRRSCNDALALFTSGVSEGMLDDLDCRISLREPLRVDLYELATVNQQAVDVSLTGLPGAQLLIPGVNAAVSAWGATDIRMIGARGTRTMSVWQPARLAGGRYTIRVQPSSGSADNCAAVLVEPGITTSQALTESDCAWNPDPTDRFTIFLTEGQQLRVSLASDEVDTQLEILKWAYDAVYEEYYFMPVARNADAAPGATGPEIVFTAPDTTMYLISAASKNGQVGRYTLTTSEVFPASS